MVFMNIFMLAQAQDAAAAAGQEPSNMFQQILSSPPDGIRAPVCGAVPACHARAHLVADGQSEAGKSG